MAVMYRSDRSTGEVFETREFQTPKERAQLLEEGWNDTPRWHVDPKPGGAKGNSPYEAVVPYTFQGFPQTLHKAGWKTLSVKNAEAKSDAIGKGWSESPVGQKLVNEDGEPYVVFTKHDYELAARDSGGKLPGQKGYDASLAIWKLEADDAPKGKGRKGAEEA